MKAYNVSLIKNDNSKNPPFNSENERLTKKYFLFDYFDFLEIDDFFNQREKPDLEDWFLAEESVGNFLEYSRRNKYQYDSFSVKQKLYMCTLSNNDNFFNLNSDELPYILVMQLSFNEIFYKSFSIQSLKNTIYNVIIERIKKIIATIFDEVSEKISYSIDVFQLMSSGDLAVIVKSDTLCTFPEIQYAISLLSVESNNLEDKTVPKEESIVFTTYSLVGVDINYTVKEKDFHKDDQVVIRCTYSDLKKQKVLLSVNNATQTAVNGNGYDSFNLIGPYDLSVRMNSQDFEKIYPSLINAKLAKEKISSNNKDVESGVIDFIKSIEDGDFSTINERIFFHYVDENSIKKVCDDKLLLIKAENTNNCLTTIRESLENKIVDIRKKIESIHEFALDIWEKDKVPSEIENAAYEYNRILSQVISGLSSKTKQDYDAVIVTDLIDLTIMFTKKYLELYKNKTIDEFCLIDSVMRAVSMIGRYMNQVYTVTLNNYESPIFYTALPAASEKMLVAYTHFLMTYANDIVELTKEGKEDEKFRRLVPLVEPDMKFYNAGLDFVFSEIEDYTLNLVNVKSPSYVRLAQPCSQIHAFTHEIGHYFPFAERKTRNIAYMNLAFTIFSGYVFSSIFPEGIDQEGDFYKVKEFFVNLFVDFFYNKTVMVDKDSKDVEEIFNERFLNFCRKIDYFLQMCFFSNDTDCIYDLKNLIYSTSMLCKKHSGCEKIMNFIAKQQKSLEKLDELFETLSNKNPLTLLDGGYENAVDVLNGIVKDISKNLFEYIISFMKSEEEKIFCDLEKSIALPTELKCFLYENLTAFNELICKCSYLEYKKKHLEFSSELISSIPNYKLGADVIYRLHRFVNIDLQELITLYRDVSILMNKFYRISDFCMEKGLRTIILSQAFKKHKEDFLSTYYCSFSSYLNEISKIPGENVYFDSFYQLGFFSLDNMQQGKMSFINTVDKNINKLSEGNWNDSVIQISENIFKEVYADIVMIITCNMGIDEYDKHLSFYWRYVDDDPVTLMQYRIRGRLTKRIINNLQKTYKINIAKPFVYDDVDIMLEEFFCGRLQEIVNEMSAAISPLVKICKKVLKDTKYESLNALFDKNGETAPVDKQMEFFFDWFYNNRWRISNEKSFLLYLEETE